MAENAHDRSGVEHFIVRRRCPITALRPASCAPSRISSVVDAPSTGDATLLSP
jgi:hypothetical protein